MKRLLVLLLVTPAIAGPYVGIEREVKAHETTPFIGAEGEVIFEGLGVATSGSLDLRVDFNDDKGESRVKNFNVDGGISIGNNLSLYNENDLDKDFNHVESMVGIKYSF